MHTMIRATFTHKQNDVPEGWRIADKYEYLQDGKIAYLKQFPYGTTVINGQIII